MKIGNVNQKILKIISLICLVSIAFSAKLEPIKYNQLFTYPNTNEAPTMSEQLPLANYTVPFMSRSLFEEDPRRKVRLRDFVSVVKFTMYQMTRGEIEQVFLFADKNHDDLIDQAEWDAFTALFVFPFEACDIDSNYILTPDEFKTCWDADPRSKLVRFRRRYEETKLELLMAVVSTRGRNEINFADYLFLRRSLFAWRECHSNAKYIAISAFKCALRTAIPHKYHMKIDHERIYKAGLNLANDKGLIELDYVSYFRIMYYTYVFTIFGQPHDVPWLDKVQFIKAVREDRYPTNFHEDEIDILYDLIKTSPFMKEQTMNFETWCFFFNLHRLFDKYSFEKPLQITQEELSNLMEDKLTPTTMVLSIDAARTNFTEPQYLEVSMILQRLRLNERDFYYSFKSKEGQDASVATHSTNDESTINAEYYDRNANSTSRFFFFSTMCGIDKRYWTKDIYYRAFQWVNLYTNLALDKRFLVSVSSFIEKLPKLYETVNPPIAQMNRNNLVFYKAIPREIYIDCLCFLALENHVYKFLSHKLNTNQLINETLLKIIMKDYGMINVPDTVIDLAKKGYDTFRRREYIPEEVIKYLIIIQAAAGEHIRNNGYLELFGLKINKEYTRKYLPFPRKFKASPLV